MRHVASFLLILGVAAPAAAEVGVLPTIVEGPATPKTQERKGQLDASIKQTLGQKAVPLELKGCEGGVTAKCIEQAIAGSKIEIDEAAQMVLRLGENGTVMWLRLYGRDGQLVHEFSEDIADEEALKATQSLLRRAFDPAKFAGTLKVIGAPSNAEVLVDGLPIDRDPDGVPRARLAQGKHLLEVVVPAGIGEPGGVITKEFEVQYGTETNVAVAGADAPPPTAPSTVPLSMAVGVLGAGLSAVAVSAIMLPLSSYNVEEWGRRARGETFPRNDDDPLCSQPGSACNTENQDGWLDGYGPTEDQQVGQGARFMMVALSRDNEEKWTVSSWVAIGIGIAGALGVVAGSVATVGLWPTEEPTAPAADAE